MNSFHKIVLTISIIVLIISLLILGLFLTKSLLEDSYPPIISECPDYWDVSYNKDNNIICTNTSRINTGTATTNCRNIKPNTFKTNGSNNNDILCAKYQWSKECNITWDGVTNNNKACENDYY